MMEKEIRELIKAGVAIPAQPLALQRWPQVPIPVRAPVRAPVRRDLRTRRCPCRPLHRP